MTNLMSKEWNDKERAFLNRRIQERESMILSSAKSISDCIIDIEKYKKHLDEIGGDRP